jgi:hypothetical protein
MAVWLAAAGLALGAASMGWGQQGGLQQGNLGDPMSGTLPGSSQGPMSGSSRASSQAGGQRGQTSPTPPLPSMESDEPSPGTRRTAEEMERVRNSDRQKKLVEDTERLLALANELKVDVDKSTKDMLSLDVVRKADEIEKLARSVKEKMKGS